MGLYWSALANYKYHYLWSNWPSLIPHPSVYFSIIHTTLWSLPLMNSRLIFAPPYPTLVLASNIYTLLTSSPYYLVPFFQSCTTLTYFTTHHTHAKFFPYMAFECRLQHSKPTRIHISVRFLKAFFSIFFQESITLRQTRHTNKHYYIISIDFHFYRHKQVLRLHY